MEDDIPFAFADHRAEAPTRLQRRMSRYQR
jgi:hypothetical protein